MTLAGLFVSCTNTGNVSEIIKKAEQGDAAAQLEYARLLKTKGNGVEQNWQKAVEMLQSASDKGNVDALWELGSMYEFADHIAQNESKAIELYRKSAEAGSPIGMYMLAHCYQHGIAIEENLTVSDSLYTQAFNALMRLAPEEDIYVLNFVGSAYYWGDGVAVDRKKAFEYYLISARKGNPETQYKIGNCYETGQGTDKDAEQALYWYRESAAQGYAAAIDALARLNP